MVKKRTSASIKDVVVRIEDNRAFPMTMYSYARLKDLLRKAKRR